MRTLFGSNILSPPLVPIPSSFSTSNHFTPSLDLVFHSSVASSSSASFTDSPSQNDWLTPHLQQQRSSESDTSFSHGQDPPAIRRRGSPSVAFMGARRCGKSSIRKVVYEKLSPADTLYLEPTTKVESTQMPGFVHVHGCEIPSNVPLITPEYDHASILGGVGAVVWVIDCQDEYFTSIRQLLDLAVFLGVHYPHITLAVFVHKIDGLTEEYKYEAFREIRQRVQDELADVGFGDRAVTYYQTSIFDHSIFEATSKVVQKLLPQVPALEALLTRLCSACRLQKAYLIDATSKLYLATDASPTFLKDYEVCSEYVDMVVDIKQIYGWHHHNHHHGHRSHGRHAALSQRKGRAESPEDDEDDSVHDDGMGDTRDEESSVAESVISFDRSGDTYMYAREVNDYLSIVCILGRGSSADKKALIDYNASVMHDALVKIFEL